MSEVLEVSGTSCVATGSHDDSAPAQSTGPIGRRSGSSAMPDPDSDTVPRLQARVHGNLSDEELAKIQLDELEFRPLFREDTDEMRALHTEWFPLTYDDAFYQASVSGELYTLAATHRKREVASEHVAPYPILTASAGSSSSADGSVQPSAGPKDDILGIITLSTSCDHHSSDIVTVLGAECEQLCLPCEAPESNPVFGSKNTRGCIAYILTLGVIDGFRRRGLAKELLVRAIGYIDAHQKHVQAVYLHVVTYNAAAIFLYESMGFARIEHFPEFYQLHGKPYDSYLYARYMHGGKPPWRWRLRHCLKVGLSTSVKDWVNYAWCSLIQALLPAGSARPVGNLAQGRLGPGPAETPDNQAGTP